MLLPGPGGPAARDLPRLEAARHPRRDRRRPRLHPAGGAAAVRALLRLRRARLDALDLRPAVRIAGRRHRPGTAGHRAHRAPRVANTAARRARTRVVPCARVRRCPVPGRAADCGNRRRLQQPDERRGLPRCHDREPDARRAIAQGRRGRIWRCGCSRCCWWPPRWVIDSLWSSVYLFFTKAALITFGGAYAVLGYVTTQLVDNLALGDRRAVRGRARARGNHAGPAGHRAAVHGVHGRLEPAGPLTPLGSALLAGALATWATFLPSFMFILLGAPHVERLTRNARIEGALGAITAAVVGVIATLALLLAQVVLFPDGWQAAPDWNAMLIAVAAWFALERARWPLRPGCSLQRRWPGYCCACCSSESMRCWNTSNGCAPEITSPSNSPLTTRPITNDGVDAMSLDAASADVGPHRLQHGRIGAAACEARGIQSERACQLRIAVRCPSATVRGTALRGIPSTFPAARRSAPRWPRAARTHGTAAAGHASRTAPCRYRRRSPAAAARSARRNARSTGTAGR